MKKVLAVVLSVLMIMSLAACGGNNTDTEGKVKTVQSGKLIMATHATFPPYEYVDTDGETIIGIDVEIAQILAEGLGLELEIQDMEFASIITAVQSGKVDIGLAGMTVNEDRLKNVDFSTSYANGVQSIIVKEGSSIKSVDDLSESLKFGVQESTTGHIYCEDQFGTDAVTAYSHGALAVQALVEGKVDCVIIDNSPAKEFVKANPGLVILDTEYANEDYAAAISKDNPELTKAINEILDAKIADGTIKGIIDKYISAE